MILQVETVLFLLISSLKSGNSIIGCDDHVLQINLLQILLLLKELCLFKVVIQLTKTRWLNIHTKYYRPTRKHQALGDVLRK